VDRTRTLLITAVAACATLPYLNILHNGFVFDDLTQVVQNPYVRSFGYLKEVFTSNVWSFKGVAAVTNYYRPMMTLGYLVCYKLFGMRAYGFHLVSLLLHLLVVCLVFALSERLTGDRVWAFVAGALFALHPIHSESVAWIAAVTDLELTFFYLLTFGIFLAVARPGGGRSLALMAAMVVAFILALLSKEQAMTLPALATVYEHFCREDRAETSALQKLSRYGALWLAGIAYMLLRMHCLGALAPKQRMGWLTPEQTVFSAIALVGQYIGKLLWPVRLCAFYVFHPSESLLDPRVLVGLLLLLGLSAFCWVCWRSRERDLRLAFFGILWFFATLAPVLNPHWVGENVFTERYLYLPSVGVVWLVGLGGSKLWWRAAAGSAQRWALLLAGVVIGGLFAVRIVIRNRDWNNDLVLFTRTLELSPDADSIQDNLAVVYLNRGEWDKAESVLRGLLAGHPNHAGVFNNLGLVARGRKQYGQAVEFFERSIAIDPDAVQPHGNLGTTYRRMGMPGPAEREFRKALALSPVNYEILNELGQLLFGEGRVSEAEEQFRASVGSRPNALAYDFLGMLSIRRGNMGEAERDFRAALSLEESDSYAHFGLGDVLQAAGRKGEALRQYQAGLVADPTNAKALAVVQALERQIAGSAP
jgi:Flp pilus assembly protein TadD